MRVAGRGIAINVPAGWEARIFRRAGGGPVLHVASFELLDGDGDFGAAATGRMRADDVFAALIGYRVDHRIRPGVGLFAAAGPPRYRRRTNSIRCSCKSRGAASLAASVSLPTPGDPTACIW